MERLQQQVITEKKKTKYAWAKYYTEVNEQLHADHGNYDTFNRVADDKDIPEHIKQELKTMAIALKKKWECPVCTDMIEDNALVITNCGHYYCKACLDQWKQTCRNNGETKWSCGMCNRKFRLDE